MVNFSHAVVLVCLLHSIVSTPEDPELTFEHLYQFGKNEYTSKNWHDCISFLLRATEDYRYYRDETIWCRQKCAMQISEIPPTINASTETVASIRLMYAQAQKALCLLRCRAEKFTPQRPPLSNYAIYEEFQNRRQYHYLQFCYWKMGDLRSAVKSAFTHLVANPDSQESLDNVKFYMTQPGYNADMLVDALQMQYEKYYISGTEAYNAGEWHRCITDFQESLKLFFEEEQECRMMCEDSLDWTSLEGDNPETSIVITSIYASVVRCRAKCIEKLSKVNGHHIDNFLASYFEYLHVCYYKLNRGRDACQAVSNAILLDPSNIVMRRNKLFYMKSYPKQDLFVPSDDIVEYYSRAEREHRFLDFIDSRFKYVDGMLPTESIQDRTVFDPEVDLEDDFEYTRLEGDLLSADECKRLSTAATLPEQAVKYTRNLIAEVGKRIAEGYGTEPQFHSLDCASHAVASGCSRSAFVLAVDEHRCSAVLSDVFDGCALVFCTK